jgi:hypothetical protein
MLSLDVDEAIDAAAALTNDAELARALMRAGSIDATECLVRCLKSLAAHAKTTGTVVNALAHLDDLVEEARSLAHSAECAARDLKKLANLENGETWS